MKFPYGIADFHQILTEDYFYAENIYLDPRFHDMCGFTEAEIRQALNEVAAGCGLPASEAERCLAQMRSYYNGYCFTDAPADLIYNPTLALYFLKHTLNRCETPSNMLDSNLAMDGGKLSYIAQSPGGAKLITDALQTDSAINVPVLADRFGVEDCRRCNRTGNSWPRCSTTSAR
jgi:hypothetical protein